MQKPTFLWQAGGFAFVTLAGTLLHFLFDWTGGSILVAPISGVNESTWEHMKLLFWPLFTFALFQGFQFRDMENFWCVKRAGTLPALFGIPVLFYTYNGAFGPSPDWVNIAIFYICAAIAFLLEWRFFQAAPTQCKRPWLAFATICLVGVLFVVFTFAPPKLPLFRDPLTGSYGLQK